MLYRSTYLQSLTLGSSKHSKIQSIPYGDAESLYRPHSTSVYTYNTSSGTKLFVEKHELKTYKQKLQSFTAVNFRVPRTTLTSYLNIRILHSGMCNELSVHDTIWHGTARHGRTPPVYFARSRFNVSSHHLFFFPLYYLFYSEIFVSIYRSL